jgi:hypothetical protein
VGRPNELGNYSAVVISGFGIEVGRPDESSNYSVVLISGLGIERYASGVQLAHPVKLVGYALFYIVFRCIVEKFLCL